MLSLNLILVLLAVVFATWAVSRLTRKEVELQKQPQERPKVRSGVQTGVHQTTNCTAKAAPLSPSAKLPASATESGAQNIDIDADRPIEPDLAAALHQADVEIRLAEEHAMLGHDKTEDLTGYKNHSLPDNNIVVLEPRETGTTVEVDSGHTPDVSISDAELVEPGQPHATGQELRDNAQSDLITQHVECNSAQLMLVDSYTDILIGSDNLQQSIHRVAQLSDANRRAHSHGNAEQQRKLILADARASRQRKELDAERKVRHAAEKLITKQQNEIKRVRAQMASLKKTLATRQAELEQQKTQLTRSRMMARSAAKLARRAAVTQQHARDLAENEKKMRHRVETRTHQAITIAKNAISALAEQEKKNGANSVIN